MYFELSKWLSLLLRTTLVEWSSEHDALAQKLFTHTPLHSSCALNTQRRWLSPPHTPDKIPTRPFLFFARGQRLDIVAVSCQDCSPPNSKKVYRRRKT